MTTSTIKSVVKTESTWQGQSGTMYEYEIEMEDGAKGIASSTNPDNPPYGVGDEVQYTSKTDKWGTKLSIRKASTFQNGGGFKPDPKKDELVTNSWALKTAVQIIGQCQKEETYEQYIETAGLVAKLLIYKRDNL